MIPFLPLATALGAYSSNSNITCLICLQHKAHHLYPKRDLTGKSLNSPLVYLLHHCCSFLVIKGLISEAIFFLLFASLSKLLLIILPSLSPFLIFFNKSFLYLSIIATTLFILCQEDIMLSRASRISFPAETQFNFFISGSSYKIFSFLSSVPHSASGFLKKDGS